MESAVPNNVDSVHYTAICPLKWLLGAGGIAVRDTDVGGAAASTNCPVLWLSKLWRRIVGHLHGIHAGR